MPFWDSVSTHMVARTTTVSSDCSTSSIWTSTACGTSWRVRLQHLLAHELGQHHVLGLVGEVLGREVERALGQQAGDELEQLRDALAGAGGDRVDLGVGQAELARDLQRLDGLACG